MPAKRTATIQKPDWWMIQLKRFDDVASCRMADQLSWLSTNCTASGTALAAVGDSSSEKSYTF